MAKNRINTSSVREIKSSFKRFLSLLIMSALGASVFIGLKMSAPDMIKSLDTYYDSKNVYDIKVISTLGLTNSDINNLKKIKGVKNVYGSYSKDVILKNNINESVAKIIGINNKINKIDLIKGKMPTLESEIVVEQNLLDKEKLSIGSTIKILDDETFKNTKLKIVGVVKSPLYISSITAAPNRGNTNLGAGKISYYAYTLNSNFKIDYYTEIYVNVKGAKKEETDSSSYRKKVNNAIKNINKIKRQSEKERYDEIYNLYNSEIEKNELDGKIKLEDAKRKLDNAKKELSNGKKVLDDSKIKLDSAKIMLDENEKVLELSKKTLNDSKEKLDNGKIMLDEASNKIDEELSKYGITLQDINNIREFLNKSNLKEDDLINNIDKIKPYKDFIDEILNQRVKDIILDYATSNEFKSVITSDTSINVIKSIVNNQELIDELKSYVNDDLKINEILDNLGLNNEEKKIVIEIIKNNELYNVTKNIVNNASLIENTRKVLNDNDAINKIKNIINSNLTKENIIKLWKLSSYDIKDMLNNLDEFNSAKESYINNLSLYNDGLDKYNEGKKLYDNYFNDYQNGLSLYNNGVIEYNKNLNLYNSGVKEYYDSLYLFNSKISDAKNKLNEIPKAKWYVYSRNDDNEYSNFIDDGKSVSNLAKLFPTIFYVVAVLISLISMSRMVEDDRLEIGTLKSLGFSNRHISKKYLLYSGIATLIGGILGAVLGYFILTAIIWNIYKILFSVPVFRYSTDITNVIIGILIEIICICGTTMLTIRKVLKEKPSDLMRPKAPPSGKRILLERVPFIWNKLNFSNKITTRNLFRYKKRVIMTIFGILGCTALMLAGFGIRDSIVDIPNKQFNEIFYFDDMAYLTGNLNQSEIDNLFNDKHIKKRLDTKMVVSSSKGESGTNIFIPNAEKDISNVMVLRDKKTKRKLKLEDNKIIITDKLAELKKKKIGDKLKIYDADGNSYYFEISGICENYVGHYVFMDKKTYESSMGGYQTNMVYYTLDNIKYDARVSKNILKNDGVMSIISVNSTMKTVDNMLKSLNSVVFILIILSGALSFVVLYNLSYINISERKREIATLKVLGFTDKEVDNYIIKETTILTILGILLGLLFGIILTNLIIDTVEIEMVRFLHKINLISYIKVAFLVMLFNIIVSFIIHKHLRKIDMIESLKSVE
ncbi:MAG: FtsX-like permease family protein [Bacilli bacterium]|nr:FtsX-like permease family protein [Bacilli bacterium]